MNNIKSYYLLFIILSLAAFFRFYGLNWDQGFHLHPDERFLTMVGNSMKLPTDFFDYLNPRLSTLNPINIGYNFFVYGTFPIILNKIIALLLNNDNYMNFTIQGRFLSGIFDLFTLVFIYKIVKLFEKKYNLDKAIKFFAGFFYAIAILPIQLSHFFITDTFLNFFLTSSFYYILSFYFKKQFRLLVISAILFGLAFSSKISAIYFLPLILIFILYSWLEDIGFFISRKISILKFFKYKNIFSLAVLFMSYFLVTYFTVRLAGPYYFQNDNILSPEINTEFIKNISALNSFKNPEIWYPPGVQWVNKTPIIFAFNNLVIFGVGIPYFIFIVLGIYFIFKLKKLEILTILIWSLLFFLYQSRDFSPTMRYFIFLYPFLAIFAALGLKAISKYNKLISVLLLFTAILTPLFFISIYTKGHSRVEASKWIYENFENNSVVLGEHWDDALPLTVKDNYGKSFRIEQLPVFGPDNEEKWQQMNNFLNEGNYLVLSSNRGWGSIPGDQKRYPLMSKFYKDLFEGKLKYKKIKEFTSYPSLNYLGIPIALNDDGAEEAFTVYDHPKVIIFKKFE